MRKQFGLNRKCTCGKYSFVIDAAGNIKACGCDIQSFGNILDVSFAEAIMKMEPWRDGSLLPESCKACRWLPYCGGGCRSDAISTHGKSCMPDSTADLSSRTAQLVEQSDIGLVRTLDSGFLLNPECRFTEEGPIVRISYKTNYDYVSAKFFEFLRNSAGFSAEDLVRASGADMDMVLLCLTRLMSKKLLIEGARDNRGIMTDQFALLVSPYVRENAPEWVNEYAGMSFSNIRHS